MLGSAPSVDDEVEETVVVHWLPKNLAAVPLEISRHEALGVVRKGHKKDGTPEAFQLNLELLGSGRVRNQQHAFPLHVSRPRP